jgi:predicted Rossmann fold flavoprotein
LTDENIEKLPIVCIGAGAAGFFGAICSKTFWPDERVVLLEKSKQVLTKVKISGGGRCNVTHHLFDPKELVKNYPRGSKALLGPFYFFQPQDTINWFTSRGVELKKEEDGRVFPVTNSSQTIIDCLQDEAKKIGVELYLLSFIDSISKDSSGFIIVFKDRSILKAKAILLATGSSKEGFEFAKSLGHKIKEPVPSLFTFNSPASPLSHLSGSSITNASVQIEGFKKVITGPVLITHFGFSGPAILKLSAFAARFMHEKNYEVNLKINWLPEFSRNELIDRLIIARNTNQPFTTINPLTKAFWEYLTIFKKSNALSNQEIASLAKKIQEDTFMVSGKTTNKQEFVTAGGVEIDDVDFKTMQSKICRGLYFAGEILDIDGVTGGFNFQNAWTSAFIAGKNIGK